MTAIEVVFHLPGVVIEGEGSFPLGSGRVEALSFDQWQRIDNAFYFASAKFTRSRPVFWVGNVNLETVTQENILKEASTIRYKVHSAFLLEPRLPWIPTPVLSVTYCRVPTNEQVVKSMWLRQIGPMEREWVVYGSDVNVYYDATTLSQVDQLFTWLEKFYPLSYYKSAFVGLSVLERTARPDSWWGDSYKHSINDFVHCVAACEDLMLQPNTKNLTDTFGRHAAALTSSTHSKVKQLAKPWSQVYHLRTKLMHGRIGLDALDDNDKKLLSMARNLLREIIIAVLSLQLCHDDEDSLPSLLAQAFVDPVAHATLHQRLEAQT